MVGSLYVQEYIKRNFTLGRLAIGKGAIAPLPLGSLLLASCAGMGRPTRNPNV
jgi:hypothetical protein